MYTPGSLHQNEITSVKLLHNILELVFSMPNFKVKFDKSKGLELVRCATLG